MARLPLTVLVHTLNEADQIEECLRSVDWADEIYLLDSHSSDGTVDTVRRGFPNARVEQREFFGSASQKNYGMDRAAHDWILVVDADERVTPQLRNEIESLLESTPSRWAYSIGRREFILGKEVRWSRLRRDRVTRLFHRRHARYENRRVHASLLVDGEVGRLNGQLLHYNIRSFEHMLEKHTRFGIWWAAQSYLEGRQVSAPAILVHPFSRFVRDYVFNLGFLHGTRGLIAVGLQTYYTFWKYAKLWEFNELKRNGKPVPLPRFDSDPQRWVLPWEGGILAAHSQPNESEIPFHDEPEPRSLPLAAAGSRALDP